MNDHIVSECPHRPPGEHDTCPHCGGSGSLDATDSQGRDLTNAPDPYWRGEHGLER